MTHSLHRQGDRCSLERDFVVLACTAKGYNDDVFCPLAQEFARICLRHEPVNVGDMKTGSTLYMDAEEIISRVSSRTIVDVTFDSREKVVAAIKDLAAADLGISVVISGLHDVVDGILREAGVPPVHTREYSLGVHGHLKLLPEEEILEFTTMCGHAMVAKDLVKEALVRVKLGRSSLRQAALLMGKCCSCGNFNVTRAIHLLSKNLPRWVADFPLY